MDVICEGPHGGSRKALAVRPVLGDRPTVGLVPADGELHCPHAEGPRRRGDGGVSYAVDSGGAQVDRGSIAPVGPDPTSNAVPSLEHHDATPGLASRRAAARPPTSPPCSGNARLGLSTAVSLLE